MEEKKTKQKLCDMYVNWQAFIWALTVMSTIMFLVIGVAMNAKAQNAKTESRVDVLDEKFQNIQTGINELNKKFDQITEVKIRQEK